MVANSKPADLAQFHGIGDFPLPRKIDTLIKSKRTLKSTKAKEMQKRSKSWSSLPETSASGGLRIPKSLQKECLVRTREEDPEVLRERQAAVKERSVRDLSQITGFSDIPIPATLGRLVGGKKKDRKAADSSSRYIKKFTNQKKHQQCVIWFFY